MTGAVTLPRPGESLVEGAVSHATKRDGYTGVFTTASRAPGEVEVREVVSRAFVRQFAAWAPQRAA